MCNGRDIITSAGSSIMCLHSGCRSLPLIAAPLTQQSIPLSPMPEFSVKSFSFSAPVSNFEHLLSCASVKFPEGFGRIHDISPIRHLLRLSSAVTSGRRFEHCSCFVPTAERENSGSSATLIQNSLQ